jgi:hypothetical protein
MRARPTDDDRRLAKAVHKLTAPGGSVALADLAAHLHRQLRVVKGLAEAAERRGVAYCYSYQGQARVGLSNEGWALAGVTP